MNNPKSLRVLLDGTLVGTLAVNAQRLVAFSYDEDWLQNGFSISPLSLPLQEGVFLPKKYDPFEGLFGLFADSLPDGWGRLLVDRLLKSKGLRPVEINAMQRLSIVGSSGMGALTYEPEQTFPVIETGLSLDELAAECKQIFSTEFTENLDELFLLGGSSGGARPKIFYQIDGEDWIVKFPSSLDKPNIGRQEYEYSLCAKKCGIDMPETRLLSSKLCDGYFAVKRFDRAGSRRIHMVSVSGLLETSHRIPNLDYHTLMQLTMVLTKSYEEIEKLFRQMCFHVFAHNRDDHSKNFSFLCENGVWRLSPAYDMTYSNSIGGEHATTVNGNGTNPGRDDLLAVAKQIQFSTAKAEAIVDEVEEIVAENLNDYKR